MATRIVCKNCGDNTCVKTLKPGGQVHLWCTECDWEQTQNKMDPQDTPDRS